MLRRGRIVDCQSLGIFQDMSMFEQETNRTVGTYQNDLFTCKRSGPHGRIPRTLWNGFLV
jgi:hypothetical protein